MMGQNTQDIRWYAMKEKKYGNQDVRETSRELTEAEKKRLARFEALSARMEEEGYRRVELTVSIVKANIFAVVLLIPLLAAGFVPYLLLNRGESGGVWGPLTMLLYLAALAGAIVVHEGIHGASWAIFAERHFGDIEFGFMKQYLTPYCTCGVPLSKGQYIFGALTPFFLLGVLPMAAGILSGSMFWLTLGIIMADSAAGDLMIVWNILRYRSDASRIVYIDHPTQAGGVLFEK